MGDAALPVDLADHLGRVRGRHGSLPARRNRSCTKRRPRPAAGLDHARVGSLVSRPRQRYGPYDLAGRSQSQDGIEAVASKGVPLPVRKAIVTAAIGLHARPAAVFVRAVTETGLPVTISKDGQAGGRCPSLLEVMTEDFECGCEVELAVAAEALPAATALQTPSGRWTSSDPLESAAAAYGRSSAARSRRPE